MSSDARPPGLLPSLGELELELSRRACERSLLEFVRQAWHVVEPGTDFVEGWHIEAICLHLEAVSRGEIRDLLINMPPRHMKSLLVAVFWPCWEWTRRPETRFLFSSYAQKLSTRDSLKCRRILESPWYQERWGERFALTSDQNEKMRFENNRTGYRIATSVGGTTTGEGGDVLVCFPADEMVQTTNGPIPIGEIVEKRLAAMVPSLNTRTGAIECRPIVGWHKNPGRPIVEVVLDDGATVRCTPEHRLWTARGWVAAENLTGADVLPCPSFANVGDGRLVDAKSSREGSVALGRGEDFEDLLLGEFRHGGRLPAVTVVLAPAVLRDIAPCDPESNLMDGSGSDTVSLGNDGCALGARGYLAGQFLREDGSRTVLVDGESPVSFRVSNVLGAGPVCEVGERRVARIAVQVAHLHTFWARANKDAHHDLVNKDEVRFPVAPGTDAGITVARCSAQNLARALPAATDPAKIGYFVAGKIRDRKPVLVRQVGHVDATFCITVEDTHTFYAGDGIPVANCDDPHNVQEADSDALRESACEWWFQAMSTRRNDPKTGRRVVVMQRVHEDDLSGQILDRGGYEHLCLPARFEPERACETGLGWCDPRTEDGELLWPEQCPEEELAKLERELGSAGAAGQMQQRPSPKGGLLIRESWWRFYGHGDPAGLYPFETPRELHDRADEVLQSWDCTFKDLKDSDWVVGTIWARIGAHKFLLAEYRGRWDLPATIAAIYRATADWERATLKLIEDKANGPAVMQTLRGQVTGLVPVEPQGGKIARVNAVSPQIEAGDVFLPHPRHAPWVGAYIDEHSRFPLGKHDDRVDSTSQALLRMRSGMAKPCGVNIPAPAGAYRPQRNSRFWGAR